MKHFLFPVLIAVILVLIACTSAPTTETIPSSVATTIVPIAPTAIANPTPLPSSTFTPTSSPTPAATNTAEATPTEDVNALFQDYLQQNADAQQAINQYAIAMGFNMSDTADRLSQPGAQISLKDGTLVIVDSQTSVPIFVLGQKDGQPTWSGDTLKTLSDSLNLDFGLELDPTRDSVRDPRFSEFNTVSPSVFGFTYIHRGGLDAFNTSAIADCVQQFNNQHIVGFPLVPEVDQENTSLFNSLSEAIPSPKSKAS